MYKGPDNLYLFKFWYSLKLRTVHLVYLSRVMSMKFYLKENFIAEYLFSVYNIGSVEVNFGGQ